MMKLSTMLLVYNHLVHFGNLLQVLEDAPLPEDPPWSLKLRIHLEGMLTRYREVFAS
jgi:hypothetical protein